MQIALTKATSLSAEPKKTTRPERKVAYRCSCGADVLIGIGGNGVCDVCGKPIVLGKLDPSQTISFCADVGSGTSFQLMDGPDRTGESLGHFRLMSKLGFGGMGAVYRALDESLQRFVAVKVIRSSDRDGESSRKLIDRLLDEAVAQARLNHPNVVTIYYVGRDGEEPFFAMELLPGPTLAQLIIDEPLPFKDVIHFSRQVCSALAQANRLGLVHGDIKPSNLILADDRTVKLSDFGLAKTEETGPHSGISGTISYMAPELSRGSHPTTQSDMYSLGVTLFELAFGRRPYAVTGTTLREQLDSRKEATVEFPGKWPPTVPEQFRDVLERLLARDPRHRYDDFEQLDQVLQAHAPVDVVPASLSTRAFALIVDYSLLGVLMLPFVAAMQFAGQGYVPERAKWIGFLVFVVPLIASLVEQGGRRTLGRYLMQLRLVDDHGMLLGPKKRLWRSLIRNSPIWIFSLWILFLLFRLELPAALLSPLDESIMLIDMIPALGPRRMALHDRLVGSRVVLDTQGSRLN